MEEKFAELDTLLEKTAVYSQFLADRLNERVAEKDHVTEEGNTVEKDVKYVHETDMTVERGNINLGGERGRVLTFVLFCLCVQREKEETDWEGQRRCKAPQGASGGRRGSGYGCEPKGGEEFWIFTALDTDGSDDAWLSTRRGGVACLAL